MITVIKSPLYKYNEELIRGQVPYSNVVCQHKIRINLSNRGKICLDVQVKVLTGLF